jgi:hypothetical protein
MEFSLPILLGLPRNAATDDAQGQFGFGATYFAANSGRSNAAMPFLQRAFLRFHDARNRHALRLGRMELFEGAESVPKATTLAALKNDRIQQRLLGNFGFTHGQRSFDGVHYAFDDGKTNVTIQGARPTRGVFQVDGWGQLNVNVFHGSVTRQIVSRHPGEWRAFAFGYNDYRAGVLKSDNRALPALRADGKRIDLATLGGHYLRAVETRGGTLDFLLWGALQTGSWGTLRHRAGAGAFEAGWQPPGLPRLRPWLRGGYNYASGDDDPSDQTHGTFFQLLPTPRGYARFPFSNMMNTTDAFGEIIVRPRAAVNVRASVHSLGLASRGDLWYVGGGAFQPWTFGFAGRPASGESALATLYDASLDYNISRPFAASVYFGFAAGGPVIERLYPRGKNGSFGFLEFTYRF